MASYSSCRVCRGCARSYKPSVPSLPTWPDPPLHRGLLSSSVGDEWGAVPFSQFNAAQCQVSTIGCLHPSHGTLQPQDMDVNLVQPSDFTKNWNSKEIKHFVQMTNWYQSLTWKPDFSSIIQCPPGGPGKVTKMKRWEGMGPAMRKRIPSPRAQAVRRAGIAGRALHFEVEFLCPLACRPLFWASGFGTHRTLEEGA